MSREVLRIVFNADSREFLERAPTALHKEFELILTEPIRESKRPDAFGSLYQIYHIHTKKQPVLL